MIHTHQQVHMIHTRRQPAHMMHITRVKPAHMIHILQLAQVHQPAQITISMTHTHQAHIQQAVHMIHTPMALTLQ